MPNMGKRNLDKRETWNDNVRGMAMFCIKSFLHNPHPTAYSHKVKVGVKAKRKITSKKHQTKFSLPRLLSLGLDTA